MHAARLYADVDPGGCGALRHHHDHLQDSNEAGPMGRGLVAVLGVLIIWQVSHTLLAESVESAYSVRPNYT